jgi:hypothetical protein
MQDISWLMMIIANSPRRPSLWCLAQTGILIEAFLGKDATRHLRRDCAIPLPGKMTKSKLPHFNYHSSLTAVITKIDSDHRSCLIISIASNAKNLL